MVDKAAVTRQFELGYQAIGAEFAMGDGRSYLFAWAHPCVALDIRSTTG